jgi:hypothetical protein
MQSCALAQPAARQPDFLQLVLLSTNLEMMAMDLQHPL